jgi:pimeloyl-ACP methyl ester carboxylesterase
MKAIVLLIVGALFARKAVAADSPPAVAFQVLSSVSGEAPSITPYLRYQVEVGWRYDDERRRIWSEIRTEEDLFRIQRKLHDGVLAMIGDLPTEKTPLHPQITGTIQMEGFRIEKLIFESMPGIYVTALVYVPEDGAKKHPAILVPVGHATNGKVHYQALCQRLVHHGYVVICWDPPGQAERSQFWDSKTGKSRYNLICAEHAVLGNLAYLAGTNLARWEIWDGIRAVDYLLSRADVDADRINITGTSGGGFQTAAIAALDPRIKVVAPSCYITALPMRMYNRIFKDPDSDPEQDFYGMVSEHLDHPGLLLMMYPRPVFVAAAVLDFFPIEGTQSTVREVRDLYSRLGHADRIGLTEGYHGHQFSPENQEAAVQFLDHFNGINKGSEVPAAKELDDKTLQCTRTGQVMLDFENAHSVMNSIRDYYLEREKQRKTLKEMYYTKARPPIDHWTVAEFEGSIPGWEEIRWEKRGGTEFDGIEIDKYLLRHSRYLEMPLLHIHKKGVSASRILFWETENGKATQQDWPEIARQVAAGYDVISIDPRGLGETRMRYKAVSPDDPTLAQLSFDQAYVSPLSSVMADYVYNSLLVGRPYLLQTIEDVEIARRFVNTKISSKAQLFIAGPSDGSTFASATARALDGLQLAQPDAPILRWSEIVDQKKELWPIQYLLPGGAYVQ